MNTLLVCVVSWGLLTITKIAQNVRLVKTLFYLKLTKTVKWSNLSQRSPLFESGCSIGFLTMWRLFTVTQCSDKIISQLWWQCVNKRPSHIQLFFQLALPWRKTLLLSFCWTVRKNTSWLAWQTVSGSPGHESLCHDLREVVVTHQEPPNPWMWSDVLWPPCDVVLGTLQLTLPTTSSPRGKETEA